MKIKDSYIELTGLRFTAKHGVLPQERVVGGEYTVDVRVGCDISGAVVSDDLHDTLNYAEIYQIVSREMQQPSSLLEHVAGRIGESIFKAFPEVGWIEVKLTKCNPPMGADGNGATVFLRMENE